MKYLPKLYFLIGVLALLAVGEALWWHNARDSYPDLLASQVPAGANDLASLRKACGSPLEIAPMAADTAIARCGTVWPFRSIWLVPKDQILTVPK